VKETGAFSVVLKLDVSHKNLQPPEYANLIDGGAVQLKKEGNYKWPNIIKTFSIGKVDVTVAFANLEQNTNYEVRAIVHEKGRAFTEVKEAKVGSFKTKECTKICRLLKIESYFNNILLSYISKCKYPFGN